MELGLAIRQSDCWVSDAMSLGVWGRLCFAGSLAYFVVVGFKKSRYSTFAVDSQLVMFFMSMRRCPTIQDE